MKTPSTWPTTTGISLATVSGDVDLLLDSSTAGALTRIFGAIAQQEAEQKGARQKYANRQKREDGRMSWSRRPYGYERVGGTVVTVGDRKVFRGGEVIIVESEAKELRDAATKLLAGATLGSCVRDLEDRGVPTVHGKPWTVTALRRALVNPRTAGMAHYHGAVVGAGAWPPIFTQDLHARRIAHLTDPARRTAMNTATKYLLKRSRESAGRRAGARCSPHRLGRTGSRWMLYRSPFTRAHGPPAPSRWTRWSRASLWPACPCPDAAALLVSEGEDAVALRDEALALRANDYLSTLAEGVLTVDGVRKVFGGFKELRRRGTPPGLGRPPRTAWVSWYGRR